MVDSLCKITSSNLKAPPRKEIPGTTITKHSFTVMPTLDTMLDTMTGRNRIEHVPLYNPKPYYKEFDWPVGDTPGAVRSPVENHRISKAKRETFTMEVMR